MGVANPSMLDQCELGLMAGSRRVEKRKQGGQQGGAGAELLEVCDSRPGALVVSAMGGLGDELLRTLHLAGNGVVARKGQAAGRSWLWYWKRKSRSLPSWSL